MQFEVGVDDGEGVVQGCSRLTPAQLCGGSTVIIFPARVLFTGTDIFAIPNRTPLFTSTRWRRGPPIADASFGEK